MEKNKYDQFIKLFELTGEFTLQDINIAYKDLIKVWHPDRFNNDSRLYEKAQERVKEINEAKRYLIDYFHQYKAELGQQARNASQKQYSSEEKKSNGYQKQHSSASSQHKTYSNRNTDSSQARQSKQNTNVSE